MNLLAPPPGIAAILRALPAPFDWATVAAWWAATIIGRAAWRITTNVGELGPAWVLAYWLAVISLWLLGEWGTDYTVKVRRGNDVLEFDPSRRGGRWLGFAGQVLRWHVLGQAWASALAELIGYGGAIALLTVGLVWRWLALLPALWAASKVLAVHRRRVVADAQTAPPLDTEAVR
mgnify:CR=1 FL=1